MAKKTYCDAKTINGENFTFDIELVVPNKSEIKKMDFPKIIGSVSVFVHRTHIKEIEKKDKAGNEYMVQHLAPYSEIEFELVGKIIQDENGLVVLAIDLSESNDYGRTDLDAISYTFNRIEDSLNDEFFTKHGTPYPDKILLRDVNNLFDSELLSGVFWCNGYEHCTDEDHEAGSYMVKELYYEDNGLNNDPKELTVFISQPMRGLTNEQINSNRKAGVAKLKKLFPYSKITVLDNRQFDAPADYKPTDYMSNDIKMMGNADLVYFLKGYNEARGCRIEEKVAIEYGIEIKYEA